VPIGQFIAFITWPLAIPCYLLGSRGLGGLGWALLHAIGLYVAIQIGFHTTLLVAYGTAAYAV